MLLFKSPTQSSIERFLESERSRPFTYGEIGATRGEMPSHGYAIDVYGTPLGEGEACFARAASALERFENYPRGWTHVHVDGGEKPREGLVFVAHIEHLGFHSLNSCRVIYVIDETGPVRRYGFAFGTLPGHEEKGEERFEVSFDTKTGAVRYDVRAFSRPRSPFARLGAVVARALQRRFWGDTCAAMREAAKGSDRKGVLHE